MSDRLAVRKTYKLYIGGAFPRSESGRTMAVAGPDGSLLAHASKASRKDLRDAVREARAAQPGWAARSAYNRGQILYRVAEMMEGRRAQFVDELVDLGARRKGAGTEVDIAVDRWVWYAGWADKVTLIAGTVDPVAGPFFTFTVPEATGVVGVFAPEEAPLAGLVSRLAPALVGGNTVVALASQTGPLPAITLAEVLATSDLPGGVVNVLTGDKAELAPWLLGHGDVDAVDLAGAPPLDEEVLGEVAMNVKRVVGQGLGETDWTSPQGQGLDAILDLVELKTVWHPTGV
jgi:acyl-CoA reductase-like NAD-dependent aldehyde dehydrogenase